MQSNIFLKEIAVKAPDNLQNRLIPKWQTSLYITGLEDSQQCFPTFLPKDSLNISLIYQRLILPHLPLNLIFSSFKNILLLIFEV